MDIDVDYAIIEIIQGFLGKPKSESSTSNKSQWQFNCPGPTCRHDVDKFNLEYNSKKKMFKCWKCEPKFSGHVYSLVKEYGSNQDLLRLSSILPSDKIKKLKDNSPKKARLDHNLVTCKLPEGYIPIGKKRNTNLYKTAWNYLVNERKVSPNLIDKYQIGYTETGPRRFRIIIPSKNSLGKFNYYEARSYLKNAEIPYIKPSSDEVAKSDIIFNEYFINWDLPVFLVEGVFDMLRLPNAIPVLGKEASELLIDELLKHNSTVIICFDPDAIKKTEETFSILSSLGLNTFFVDLTPYNKDISKIFEDHGKEEVARAIKNLKKINLFTQVSNKLKN
jgi:hypothetical protein